MDAAAVVYAFGAGMLGAFNPCGFVLLPAYAAGFLAQEGGSPLARVAPVAARMTGGFLAVFALAGLAAGLLGASLPQQASRPFLLGVSLLLALAGLAALSGVKLPGVNLTVGSSRTAFSYGMAYAAASLACALPVFLSSVVFAFGRSGGFLTGLSAALAYGVGMSTSVLLVLLAAASARASFISRLRASSAHFSRAAGALMLLAGLLLAARELLGFSLLDRASTLVQSSLDRRLWLVPVLLLLLGLLALRRRGRDA